MTTPLEHRRAFLQLLLAACVIPARGLGHQATPAGKSVAPNVSLDAATSSYHVHPGGRIQDALEAAAKDSANKKVVVHAGTYRPSTPGQAMIWFNARHDGITLEAAGDVILTAANPELADRRAPSFPAVVNHVVYFGDGISRKTVLRGFKITGAKNFTTGSGDKSPIESDDLRKTPFFYTDGGGIKIYARSYPTIESVEVYENYSSPCGGGVSVEHLQQMQDSPVFRNCIFRDNGAQATGSAFDILHNSSAVLENCLFVGNVSNMGVDLVGLLGGAEYLAEHGSGALTVFDGSRAVSQQVHVHGQLVRRRRRWQGQQLRRLDFLEEHAEGGNLAGIALRARHHRRLWRARLIHSRRCCRSARRDRSQGQYVRSAGPALRQLSTLPQAPQYANVGYRPVKAGAAPGSLPR